MDNIADIKDQPAPGWAYIRFVAQAPFTPEPLDVEERRHRLRMAYRSATTCILSVKFGWTASRAGKQSPLDFTTIAPADSPAEERIIMALAPSIAEALFLGQTIERHEAILWSAMGPVGGYQESTTPESLAISAIRETQPRASYQNVFAAFRTHERAIARYLSEASLWERIKRMAEAFAARH